MVKFVRLVLSSCLGAAFAPQGSLQSAISGQEKPKHTVEALPIYYRVHAAELAPKTWRTSMPGLSSARDYAAFIDRETEASLPPSMQPHSHEIAQTLIEAANDNRLDPALLMAIIAHESGFHAESVGTHGEIGLMQIRPETAAWLMQTQVTDSLRQQLFEPSFNIRLGARYVAYLRRKFHGRSRRYLAAYNMGATSLRMSLRAGREPKLYSARVLAHYERFTNWSTARRDSPIRSLTAARFKVAWIEPGAIFQDLREPDL
jgi:soluble lytic murein transglycosylase